MLGDDRAYSRDDGTPGWEALEEIVGGLEGGSSLSFASGMAAIAAVFDQLPTGASIALPDDCYQGVVGLANAGQSRGRWTVHRLAGTDTAGWIDMCGVADLIWLESPSNPLLTVADVDAICAERRKPGAILGVDNTFATPLNQRPLALGADVSVQSVTSLLEDTRICWAASSACATATSSRRFGAHEILQARRRARWRHFLRFAEQGRWRCGLSGPNAMR